MNFCRTYRNLVWIAFAMVMAGCQGGEKKLNTRITLWRKDKIPYGTFCAFENLKHIFPQAAISTNSYSPAEYKFSATADKAPGSLGNKGLLAYIIISPQIIPDAREIGAIMNVVADGNQVFMSSFYFGDSLLHYLKVKMKYPSSFLRLGDSLRLSVVSPLSYDSLSFHYPGSAADNAAIDLDAEYTTVLGKDAAGSPDFIKFTYKGGGAVYLHFAPLAFSNFFLLHQSNMAYFENVFSHLPASVAFVKWDDYFRYPHNSHFSALQYILSNRMLSWAFWLVLFLLALIYLIESKRRQRVIARVPVLSNSSVDFVKTIGRLYYQRKDNGNLAAKMSAHLMDFIRSRFNISTVELDQSFIDKLSDKTGYPKEALQVLLESISGIPANAEIPDAVLLTLYTRIDEFYKYVS